MLTLDAWSGVRVNPCMRLQAEEAFSSSADTLAASAEQPQNAGFDLEGLDSPVKPAEDAQEKQPVAVRAVLSSI